MIGVFSFAPRVGVSFPTGTVHVSYFLKAELLENILNIFSSYHASKAVCSLAEQKRKQHP